MLSRRLVLSISWGNSALNTCRCYFICPMLVCFCWNSLWRSWGARLERVTVLYGCFWLLPVVQGPLLHHFLGGGTVGACFDKTCLGEPGGRGGGGVSRERYKRERGASLKGKRQLHCKWKSYFVWMEAEETFKSDVSKTKDCHLICEMKLGDSVCHEC